MRTSLSAVLFAASLLAATPALADASSGQYRGCDGYGAASSGGDGMTSFATVLLIFGPPGYGNTAKGGMRFGLPAVGDCDAALADLPQKHWMRRVSLLQARALHKAEASDFAGALADLDLAKAAGQDEPFYARSLGLSVDLARASVLRRNGDQAGAEQLALQALRARPYSRQVIAATFQAIGPAASAASVDEAIRAMARLVPDAIDPLFVHAFENLQFAEAAALFSQLTPPREAGNSHSVRQYWPVRSGMYAYALAALGRSAEARAALSDARSRQAADPAAPLANDHTGDEANTALHQDKPGAGPRLAPASDKILDEWSSEVERRILVTQGRLAEAMKPDPAHPLIKYWCSVELLDAIYKATPPAKRPAISPADTLRAALKPPAAPPGSGLPVFTPPEAETADRVPPYENGGKPLLAFTGSRADLDAEGYRVTQAGDVTTVRVRGTQSTPAIVEEMALLRAADLARQANHKGLIVVARHDTAYTVTQTYYGVPMRTDPDGASASLDVIFVDPASPPDAYKDNAWRVIDADDVYDRLAPLYIRAPKKR